MKTTVAAIAALIGGTVMGDGSTEITGACGIKEARAGDITFVANPKYIPLIEQTKASAIITSSQVRNGTKPLIITENPSLAFANLLSSLVCPEEAVAKGIHPTAVIGNKVSMGAGVTIHPYVVIEDNASIGDNTVLCAGVFVGHDSRIGADSIMYPHVTVRERVLIGSRVIVHSGSVIGSDGFGFATVLGVHHKIPQIGTVVIEDDVEIGANVAIDRARFEKTVIKHGTKIDNLVQIAHNVVIGEHSLLVAQAGVSGSTILGKNVTVAGQAGITGHITIGDNAVVAAQAGVTKSVPANTCVSGYPAKPHRNAKRINACVQKLPDLYRMIDELKAKVAHLEKALGEKK